MADTSRLQDCDDEETSKNPSYINEDGTESIAEISLRVAKSPRKNENDSQSQPPPTTHLPTTSCKSQTSSNPGP